MKCPHCNYQAGWDNKTLRQIESDKGKFFFLEAQMRRPNTLMEFEHANLMGCPNCLKTFIGVE